ncbi:MAG: ISL3 family transposase [Chloroflexales bacterium]|nr:ISL3 family transposase [Chloroflexales bacterium]
MAQQPFISIPLDIPDVRVLKTEITKAGELILTVESTLTSTTCRRCGRTLTEGHGHDEARLLRHLPILGRPVYLRIKPKRFRCPFCDDHPTTTQHLDWYDLKALHTKAYERQLIVLLINSTLTDVAAKEDVTYDALLGVLDRWIGHPVRWETLPAFTTLGIDEIALTKGHRNFVAVVSARTSTGEVHLLAVLPDRRKATVAAFLASIPLARQAQIDTVCTDMWEGYVRAAQEVLAHATLVVDRFHVAQHYRDGVDALRKQELRRLREELPEAQRDDLKHTLWPFRKRPEDLSELEEERLERLLGHSPALRRAYRLREELTRIFDTARSKADGLRRLAFWRQRVARSGLTCFDAFLKLFDRWGDLIGNYFVHRQSSGFVEGLNTKLKVLKRRCYGLTHVGRLFQRLTLDLDGYRHFSPWRTAQASVHGNS